MEWEDSDNLSILHTGQRTAGVWLHPDGKSFAYTEANEPEIHTIDVPDLESAKRYVEALLKMGAL